MSAVKKWSYPCPAPARFSLQHLFKLIFQQTRERGMEAR